MAMKLDHNELPVLSVMEPGVVYNFQTLPETGNIILDTDGGRRAMVQRLKTRKLIDVTGKGEAREFTISEKGVTALAAAKLTTAA